MEEIWVDVKGFEGIYQISNYGRLKSFKQHKEGYILQMHNRFGDYFSVVLQSKGTKRRSVRIHQLVAAAFIPNPNGLPEVNHKDGNKQNNRVDNLEWVTRKENHQHMIKMHPNVCDAMIAYNKYRAKNIEQYTLDGELIARYSNYKEASEKTGVCYRNIYQVASKTPFNERGAVRKQAGGFVWKYAE